ncbi:MAG: glycosyltransferase family 4 protein [Bacteroidota bacterium]
MNRTEVAIVDHVGLKAGMECYDLELYAALKKKGCLPTVYSNFPSPEENIITAFSFRVKENIVSFILMLWTYNKVANKIKRNGIRNCILHGFRFGFWEWMIIQKMKRSGAKLFLIVHDPGSLVGISANDKWKSRIFELCENIIVHNRYSYEHLVEKLTEGMKKKLLIIPHGNFINSTVKHSDSAAFIREHHLTRDKKYLLFFGQIKETKGLDLLLEAIAGIDPTVELIIAGRMRRHSFDKYRELIYKLKLKSRVKLFIEYISPEMRNELFNLADAVVIPYRKVYQSGVLLMAMSYGKTVIASELPPNKEIISDGVNGFLFESENTKALERVIREVMENNENREIVGKNGFQYVKQNLDWSNIAGEWIKHIEK